MTTSEIFTPFILNGGFATFGGFGPIAAAAVSGFRVTDADLPNSKFQRPISTTGRASFISLFLIAPFIAGSLWGLVHTGAFSDLINEPLSYAFAMFFGIVANSVMIKLNNMSVRELASLVRNVFFKQ